MKTLSTRMLFNTAGRVLAFLLLLTSSTQVLSQTLYDWQTTAPDGNWRQGAASGPRWNPGGLWDEPPSGSGTRLRFNNNTQTTMTNNVGAGYIIGQLFFGSGATTARTIGGNSIQFFEFSGVWPRIENQSTTLHTINFPFAASTNSGFNMELVASSGNMNFGGAINNNGRTIQIYGNGTVTDGTNRSIRLNGVVSGTGVMNVSQFGVLKINAAQTYTGQTQVDNGELWIESSGSVAAGSGIFIGNGLQVTNVAKLWLSNATGGTTFSNNFTINNGNATTREIGGLNTSGTHTFSGNITNNSTSGGLLLSTINAAGTVNYSGVLSGGGAYTVNGPGTSIFSGTAANTYTGVTAVNAGTLVLNKTAGVIAIPTNTTIAAGATIRTDAANQWGTGTPPLVTINGNGILNLNNNNQRIALTSTSATASVTLGTGTLEINNTGTDPYAGTITGTGGLTKTNTGTFTISNTGNTYTGATTVSGGVLQLGAAGVIADVSNVTLNGGTLRTGATAGFSETVGTLTATANSTIAFGTGAHTLTFANSSATTWTGFVLVSGWTGSFNGTAGTAGRLFVGNSATGLSQEQVLRVLFLNGSVYHTATILSSGEVVPTANVAMFHNGLGASWTAANTWSNTPGGPYNQSWVSGRTAYFAVASSTITGANTNAGGIVAFENVTVTATGTIGFGPSGGGIAPVYVASGRIFNFAGQNFSTAAGTGLIKNGPGILQGQGGAYPNGFTLNNGMVAAAGVNIMGDGGVLTINGGTIAGTGNRDFTDKFDGGIVVNGDFTLGYSTAPASGTALLTFNNSTSLGSSVTRTITIGGTGTYTWNGVISGTSSNLILNATAAGTLSLGAANTYGGSTTINGGTLQTNIAAALPNTTALTLANTAGAILALNNTAQTVASLSGGGASGGNINTGGTSGILTVNQSGNTSYAGVMSGTGGLTKSGAGTLTLSGANTYTGLTTITAGTLQLGAAGVIANTSNMVLNGGTFSTGATTGFAETLGTLNLTANSSINLGTGAHDITFANSSSVPWTGATTLVINGWTGTGGSSGTSGRIFFGAGGLSPAQLSQISFTGYPGTPILLAGELIPPVPPITFTWNGSISSDWSTGANWTPSSGPIVAPSATDLVVIPDVGSYTNELNISTSVACLDFTVNANGKYTLASGGTLTVNGVYTYSSATAATFDCNSTLNINGSGVSTIPAHSYGNLNLVGGNRTLASSGTISICGNYTPSAGTTTVTGSTVNFNGTTAQSILTNAAVFNNLTISNTTSTVSAGVNVTVNGTGTINASAVFVQTAGTFAAAAAATTVNGTLRTTGTGAATGSAANLIFSSTGQYNHNRDGGAFPIATWNAGSLVNVTGLVGAAPTGLGQTFSDFTYNCTGQTGPINLATPSSFACRDFNFQSSGVGPSTTSLITTTAATINTRNITVSGGILIGSGGTSNLVVNSTGTFSLSAGTFRTGGSGGGNFTLNLNGGNFNQSGGTFERFNGTSIVLFNNIGGTSTITQSAGTMSGVFVITMTAGTLIQLNSDLNIGSGASLTVVNAGFINFQNFLLSGAVFILNNGGRAITANADGFWTSPTASGSVRTSTRTFNASCIYIYNRTSGGQVTGNAYTSADRIFVQNPTAAGVTLTQSVTLTNELNLAGLLFLGNNNLTMLAGAYNVSPAGPLSNTAMVVTDGIGRLIRTVGATPVLFAVGNGTSYNPITLTNTGTSDNLGVRVINSITTPTQNDGTKLINRYWEVNEAVAGGTTLTAAAQYNAGEENVNFAAGIQLKTGLHNGTTWVTQNATSAGSGPFVVTNSSAFTPSVATYTLGIGKDDGFLSPAVIYTWNGSSTSDWGTAANWTPTGIPGAIDDVVIPDVASYTNQLDITGTRTITNFTVNANGAYSMAAASSLTVNGDYVYSSSTASTFNCTSTLVLSGSSSTTIPAHNYGNLNITGGPRVLASSGTIGICGTFTPGAGPFTITGSTVDFNGTGAQTVNAFNYFNLNISGARTTNTVTLATGTIDVNNIFSPSATFTTGGYAIAGNTFNYSGAAGQTISAFGYNNLTSSNFNRVFASSGTIRIAATFTPGTGTYTTTSSTVEFNGASAQTIPVLTASNYNNLVISGSSTKSLNATQTINGNMTINSGTFVQSTSTAYNFTITGTLTLNGGIYQQTNTANNTLNVNGAVTIAGGDFYLARGAGSTATTVANFNSNLAVSSGGIDFNDNTGATSVGTINLAGSFTGTGGAVWCSGGTTTTKGTFNFTSGSAATLNQGATSFDFINVVKSTGAGILSLGSNIVIGDGQFRVATTMTVDAGLFTIAISNTDASATSEEFRLNTLANFITAHAGGVSGAVTLSGSPTPSWQIAATSYITYSGTNQNTGMAASGQTLLSRITWIGSGNLTFDFSVSISDQFIFTNNGLMLLGANNVILSSSATIVGSGFSSTKMFVTNGTGELRKAFTSTATFTWPIGDNSAPSNDYSPATLTVNPGAGGTVGLRVVNAAHPSMPLATVYLNRYWRASMTSASYSWTGNFTYPTADVVVGPETALKLNVFDPNPPSAGWTEFSSSSAASNVLTVTAGPGTGSLNGTDITGRVDVPVYYRSVASGNWNNASIWEVSTDPTFVSPAPVTPLSPPNNANSAGIQIRNTHTVTVGTTVWADDLTINVGGVLTVGVGGNFTLANGAAATDFTIDGTFNTNNTTTIQLGSVTAVNANWNSTVSPSSFGTLNMNATAVYNHAVDGGNVPFATWNNGSRLRITAINNSSTIGGMNQTFHHVEYNCPSQTVSSVQLGGAITAVNGDFTMVSSGGGTRELRFFTNNPASNTNSSLTITGNFFVQGGKVAVTNSTSNGSATPVLNINGNLEISGSGVFDLTGTSANTAAGSTVNLSGNLEITGTGSILRTQATPSTFRFNRSTGPQTYTAAVPNTAISTHPIVWEVGNGTTQPELVLASNFILNATSGLTVRTNSTINCAANMIAGTTAGVNGSFTLQNGATIRSGSPDGIVAALTATTGSVRTGTAKILNAAANYFYNGTVNQVTGTGLPTPHTGILRIENTGAASNNTVTLTTTGSIGSTLQLASGLFAIGTGQTYNIASGGTVAASGGDFALGTAGGTLNFAGSGTFSGNSNPYNVFASGGVNFGSGTVTIQNGGRFRINAGGFVASNAPFYAVGSTLEYFAGGAPSTAYGRGLEWSAASGRGFPHHVRMDNNTNLNPANTGAVNAAVPFQTGGDVTITAGSAIFKDWGGFNMTADLIVAGNLELTGQLSGSGASGSDIFIRGNWTNNGTTVNFFNNGRAVFFDGTAAQVLSGSNTNSNPFAFFILNNAAGLTLSTTLVEVNNQITFSNGLITLGNTDLRLNNLNAPVSGAAATRYIVTNGTGRFIRNFNTSNGATLFPIGPNATDYTPATLTQNGTTDNIGVRVSVAPPFTNAVNDNAFMVNLEYNFNESTPGGNNLTTTFQWPASVEAASFVRSNSVYHGDWNGSTYQIRVASATTGSNPYVSTAVGYTGSLSNRNFVLGNLIGILPCITTAAGGEWTNTGTWTSGIIPPTGSNACITHPVTVTTADPNDMNGVTINPGGSLVLAGTRNLNFVVGGVFDNNSGSALNLGAGSVSFLGSGSIGGSNAMQFTSLFLSGATSITAAPTINGVLQLNNGSSVSGSSPVYATSSTLRYSTAAAFTPTLEWSGNGTTAGSGIPHDVEISTGTILNMPNSNRGLAGNLLISNGTLNLNGTSGDLFVAGNWTRAAASVFNPNNRAVIFNGSANQSIAVTGGGTETFAFLLSSKPSGNLVISASPATNVTVNASVGNVLQLASNNTIDLNGRTLILSGSGGNINLLGGTANIIGGAGSLLSISGGTKTVVPNAGATLSLGSNVTVALNSGLNFGPSTSTVNGVVQIALGGFVSINPPTYASGSTLRYFTGNAFNRGPEWSTSSGPGYPFNVVVDQNSTVTTVNLQPGSGVCQIAGNLTINNGAAVNMGNMGIPLNVRGSVTVGGALSGSLTLSTAVGGDLQVGGNLTRNAGGTLTQFSREVEMNGSVIQDIFNFPSFSLLAINNSAASVRINNNTAISQRLRLANGTFNLNGFTTTMANNSMILRANGVMTAAPTVVGADQYDMRYDASVTSGVEYLASATAIRDLIVSSGITLTLGADRTFNRNLELAGGDLNLGGFALTARGRTAAPAFSGSITVTGGGTRNITGPVGSRFNITGLGANTPLDYTKTVSTFGGTQLSFGSNVLVAIGDGAVDFGAGSPTTINGVLQVLLGGSVGQVLNPCVYAPGSILRFANTVDYQVGPNDKTWATGAIASGLPGIPFNVEVNDVGTDLTLQDTRALRGNLTITNGSFTLTPAYTGSFNIGGNWTRSGATSSFVHNNKEVSFDRQSAGNQTITTVGVVGGGETFFDLEVSPFGGDLLLGAGTALTVRGNLNFITGRLDIGANQLTIGTSTLNGSITGVTASRYVISTGGSGSIRQFTNLNAVDYLFPVGDATNYTPFTVTLDNGAQAGSFITTTLFTISHPNAVGSTHYLNRYWRVVPTGLAINPVYDVEFTYSTTDIVGTEATYRPVKYTSSTPSPGWISAPGSGANAIDGTAANFDIVAKTFTWENLTTFSEFTAAGDGSPLPVELLDFSADVAGNTVVLNWTTASEINNDYFTVERSVDALNFMPIGTVDGAGNSTLTRNYQLIDANPLPGVSYYRLRQTDFNGDFELFGPVAVNFSGSSVTGVSLFPNPTNEFSHVMINGDQSGKGWVRVIDITGRIISNYQVVLEKGVTPFTLQTGDLAPGQYMVTVETADGKLYNLPLIKQ